MIRYLDNVEQSPRNRIITHGVDTTIFYKHKDDSIRKEIRKTYNVKDSDILMMNIGAMTTNKGILLILEALHNLVNKLKKTQYKLLLKGSGDLYQCKEFLETYFIQFKNKGTMTQSEIDNLYNHIIFTNKTLSYAKINDLYNAADLYISPYLAEGFGMTMLEALSAGLNVLVPKSGSTHEYMNDIYGNGGQDYIFYVDSEVVVDPNGLCQNNITMNNLMSTLLNNEDKFKIGKSENAYITMKSYIEKDYSWYKVAELLYGYLDDIVSKRV
jgi:glycosyltransferase involved in cell wall biosynthesis